MAASHNTRRHALLLASACLAVLSYAHGQEFNGYGASSPSPSTGQGTAPGVAPGMAPGAVPGATPSKVDPEQLNQFLETRFAAADKNHDGKLTLQEARAGMPGVARNFRLIDTDHKGYVTLDEIKAAAGKRLADLSHGQ